MLLSAFLIKFAADNHTNHSKTLSFVMMHCKKLLSDLSDYQLLTKIFWKQTFVMIFRKSLFEQKPLQKAVIYYDTFYLCNYHLQIWSRLQKTTNSWLVLWFFRKSLLQVDNHSNQITAFCNGFCWNKDFLKIITIVSCLLFCNIAKVKSW